MNCKQCNKKIAQTILSTKDSQAVAFRLCKKCFNKEVHNET